MKSSTLPGRLSTAHAHVYSADHFVAFEAFLTPHLPYTLPLLRRLQFKVRSAQAVVVASFDLAERAIPLDWAVAFFDRFPETGTISCVLSSSLDLPIYDAASEARQDRDAVLNHLHTVFSSIKRQHAALSHPDDIVLVHSVKASTADALRADSHFHAIRDDLRGEDIPLYGKYLMHPSVLREKLDSSLPAGFYYDIVRPNDYDAVVGNNVLIADATPLIGKPSTGIMENATGLLRAWAFSKFDGSVGIVHVDPAFRRRGFGRKVVTKCILDSASAYGHPTDDLAHTDIAPNNTASIKLFESLGATTTWGCYWLRIDMPKIHI